MTLPEIVIEDPDATARRWPSTVLYVVYAVALIPTLLLAYVNLLFAGIIGGVHPVFVVVLPLVWVAGLVASILRASRRLLIGWLGLGLLAVLGVVDALVLLPIFA
jgi:hypothetical protein